MGGLGARAAAETPPRCSPRLRKNARSDGAPTVSPTCARARTRCAAQRERATVGSPGSRPSQDGVAEGDDTHEGRQPRSWVRPLG